MCRLLRTLFYTGAAILLGLLVLAGLGVLDHLAVPPKPDLPDSANWGRDGRGSDSEAVEPMKVSVSDAELNDLKARLRAFKWVEPLEDTTFDYGFNGRVMQQVVTYWLEKYDWRLWEKKINSFQNHYTRIEGLRVHFMHVKPKNAKKQLPLLLLHGWPGSVIEFHKLLPLLTTPDADGLAFEVVAASLPGYAWSEAPKKRGFDPAAAARVMNKLMTRLGFSKYYLHGGDWGSIIGHVMAVEFRDQLLGFHTNMPMQSFRHPSVMLQTMLGSFLPAGVLFDQRDCDKIYPVFGKFGDIIRESGYMHLQGTRPDSVGHALSDSPVGLAAYILEKFSVWTDPQNRFAPDGNLIGPKAAFTLDELLTNVMIYWTTGSITSSIRLYKEAFSGEVQASNVYPSIPSEVPYGVAGFAYELARVPERFIRLTHPNLLRFTDFEDRGGHFAALQLPDIVAKEVREFVRSAEAFHSSAAAETKSEL